MSNWKTLPLELPTNGQTVWLRIKYYEGQVFAATWDNTTKVFTHSASGISYPAWAVSRWKE
jgi:hypothetical protein